MLYKLAAELAMIEEIDKEAAKRKGMKGNQKQAYKNKGKGGIKSETEGLGLGSQPEPQEKPVNTLPNEEAKGEEAATKGEEAATKGEGFLKGLGRTIMEHKGAGLAGLGTAAAAGGAYALYKHNQHR